MYTGSELLIGSQLNWAWHFIRDQWLYFPWFKRHAENRLERTLPSPQQLHDQVLEVLKTITTYDKSYRAAFRYPMAETVKGLNVPTLISYPALPTT